jgi:hypothetical protein
MLIQNQHGVSKEIIPLEQEGKKALTEQAEKPYSWITQQACQDRIKQNTPRYLRGDFQKFRCDTKCLDKVV